MNFTTSYQNFLEKQAAFKISFDKEPALDTTKQVPVTISIKSLPPENVGKKGDTFLDLDDIGIVKYEIFADGVPVSNTTSEDRYNAFKIRVFASKAFTVKATILFKLGKSIQISDTFNPFMA